MFPTSENTNLFSSSFYNNMHEQKNQIQDKISQIKKSHSKNSRQQKISRLRQMNSITFINFQGVKFDKFAPMVDKQNNPYTLLVTIFMIADNYVWRNYIYHLELLIKKFTNFIQSSKGKVLQQINRKDLQNDRLKGYNFQQRIQTMLHFSNRQFQDHLLILIHSLIIYNKRYCIIDEVALSDNLVHKHPYQKCIRGDVVWLMTRMSLSCGALSKIARNYLLSNNTSPLLPVLTIIANFIFENQQHIVLQFIETSDFKTIISCALNSKIFQVERQAVFLINNLLFKTKSCNEFILSQNNLVQCIQKLNNEQVHVFNEVLRNIKIS